MHGKVKLIRRRGVRIPDSEIGSMAPIDGVLTLAGRQWLMEYVLTLRPRNNTASRPLLELFDARLITMHHGAMRFRGIERPQGDDGPAYVQEWSVMIDAR